MSLYVVDAMLRMIGLRDRRIGRITVAGDVGGGLARDQIAVAAKVRAGAAAKP
jgi:hypothetical protein